MTDTTMVMHASLRALMTMLEGESGWDGRTASILYNAFTGMEEHMVRACCDATTAHGYDGVLAFFDPADVEAGPVRIGVTLMEGEIFKLQMGRLWMAPRGDRAVLVPNGVRKRYGHCAVENGRIAQRCDWPAANLERGTRWAAARLAELTAVCLEELLREVA